jgi:competence protein ComEC
LNDADWQRYNATGTGHLLAVSGTHITLMGALLAWLAARWWQSKPQRLLCLPVQTLRLNVMLVSSGFYALIAGWALPAQRTVLMLAVVWLSLRFMARPAVWHVMASSAVVALAFDPMAVISPSFWLSYGAVAVLVAVELKQFVRLDTLDPEQLLVPQLTDWQIKWNSFKQAARSQLLLTLALVPLGAVFFNQISVVSPLANAVAIPVMGWVSTPIALIAALLSLLWGGMAAALMQALLAVQQGMDWVLDVLLLLPFAQLRVPTAPHAWAVFGLICAVGCAFLQTIWRWVSVLGVLVYVGGAFVFANLANTSSDAQQRWRVAFLDVGQGMAVAVHSQGKTLLFDAGPRYSADSDGAARVIVPYLQAAGVQRLDHVILSHADEDHTGGARSLLARMPVEQWWHSLSAAHPLQAAIPSSKLPCEAGKRMQWAGLQLHWLHPPAAINHDDHKTNAVSCVLRISDTGSGGTTTVLLTGDIEAEQEAELIARNPSDLSAQILLAPHHGSKTSSSPAFLQAVNPQHVVMQNGYRNRYGHPHPTVSQRYVDAGITQWRSDLDGAVILDVQADGFKLSAWRVQVQRYWHTVLPAAATLRATVDGREF